jgi:hypothetical protein
LQASNLAIKRAMLFAQAFQGDSQFFFHRDLLLGDRVRYLYTAHQCDAMLFLQSQAKESMLTPPHHLH